MSWYTNSGPNQNHVLFSKVMYIRNEAKRSFYHLLDSRRTEETLGRLSSLLTANGFQGENVAQGVSGALISLCEKQLIEADFVYSERQRALYLNEPCNLIVAIGGRDLISISSVTAGLSVLEAENMASRAEELIDSELSFAYNDRLGYLSPSPSAVGSGIRYSSALYLPSLRRTGAASLRKSLASVGFSLEPMFIDNSSRSDLYILSYSPYYLADEDSSIVFFSDTVSHIANGERERIGTVFSDDRKKICENARRALGTLLFCESISEGEMLELLSCIRLAICLQNESSPKELPSIQDINYLCAEGLNASVCVSANERCSSLEECDRLRATLIKRYINHKKEVN